MPAFFREAEFRAVAFAQVWPKVKLRVARSAAAPRRLVSRQDPAGCLVSRRVDSPPRRADSGFRNLDPQRTSVLASRRPPQEPVKLVARVMPRAPVLEREFQLDLPAPAFSTPNREV